MYHNIGSFSSSVRLNYSNRKEIIELLIQTTNQHSYWSCMVRHGEESTRQEENVKHVKGDKMLNGRGGFMEILSKIAVVLCKSVKHQGLCVGRSF